MDNRYNTLIRNMMEYDAGDAKRIQHFIKVHYFAHLIGSMEQLDPETLLILETAAIVHDIGIHVCEEKYGMCDGKHQELEGPAEARALLMKTGGYTPSQIDRVCWLVGHHHTHHDIEGLDYQILVEADFLVNMYEDDFTTEAIRKVREHVFKTKTGIQLIDTLFLSDKYLHRKSVEQI